MKTIPAITYSDFDSWRKYRISESLFTYWDVFKKVIVEEKINHILIGLYAGDAKKLITLANSDIGLHKAMDFYSTILLDHGIFLGRKYGKLLFGGEKTVESVLDLQFKLKADIGIVFDIPSAMVEDAFLINLHVMLLKEELEKVRDKSQKKLIKKMINRLENKYYIPDLLFPFLKKFQDIINSENALKEKTKLNKDFEIRNTDLILKNQTISDLFSEVKDLCMETSIECARKSVKLLPKYEKKYNHSMKLMPVIQGYNYETLIYSIDEFFTFNEFDFVALGTAGKATKTKESVSRLINHIKTIVPPIRRYKKDTWIHLLGVSHPDILPQLANLGIDSIDSTTFIRMGISVDSARVISPVSFRKLPISLAYLNELKKCDCPVCKLAKEDHKIKIKLSEIKRPHNQSLLVDSDKKYMEKISGIHEGMLSKDFSRRGDLRLMHNLAMIQRSARRKIPKETKIKGFLPTET